MARLGAAAVVLLTVSLAPGCILLGYEHCGPTYTSLWWTQPGLADGISNATPGARWDPGAGALPWTNPWNLTGLRLAHVRLQGDRPAEHRMGIFSYQDPHLSALDLGGQGVLEASQEGNVSDDVVLAAVQRFLDNVSAAPPEARAQAAQAFVASRRDTGTRANIPLDEDYKRWEERPIWAYRALVPAPLRLDDLVADLEVAAPANPSLGTGQSKVGPWTFEFTLPLWHLEEGEAHLAVDGLGNAHFDGAPTGNETRLRQQAVDLAAGAGLPPLDLTDAQGAAKIC